MKKIIIFVVMLLCAGRVFAATALRNGLYLNAKAGIARTQVKGDAVSAKKKGFPFAFALGARVYHFRVEAEYSALPKVTSNDFEIQTETTMAQMYYDVPVKARIRPFLNVGVGRYNMKIKQLKAFNAKRHDWAYNFGGGLTCSVSKAANLDLGYRYLRTKEADTQAGKIRLDNHMIYIGWRYVF